MTRRMRLLLLVLLSIAANGCPKRPAAKTEYQKGCEAEAAGDPDAALQYFQNALQAQPLNALYKISLSRAQFDSSEKHVRAGVRFREDGQLNDALREFQLAVVRDPSNPSAHQELQTTTQLLKAGKAGANAQTNSKSSWTSLPPELKPLSRAPINLRMTNDAKIIFDTIGKLAGISVIFDPDFVGHRVNIELNNVTVNQALDVACLESKAFWKPVTENIVVVVPDQAQKRRDFDDEVMRTFYLSNVVQAQELTEIVTGLRQLLDLKHIQQINALNAITIRDTPAKIALAQKFIDEIDKAKPELVVDVAILQASTDRLRTLGILPAQSASVAIDPSYSSSSSTTSSSSSNTSTLQQMEHLDTSDYVVTLSSFTASAVLTDSDTKIIQNPEVRMVDGMIAKLKVGDRVPVATGSYSAATSVTTSSSLSSLISTQFQYIDVGVNLDVTPRIHPNNEVSLKVAVEVSSVSSYTTIGGISEPVISQRKVEHDIRLREGEANILGGLLQRTDTKSLNGWPGLAKIPILRYFFSEDSKEIQESDVLIILTPHIVRRPEWTAENLKPIFSGTETNIEVYPEAALETPSNDTSQASNDIAGNNVHPGAQPENASAVTFSSSSGEKVHPPVADLTISPEKSAVKPGETRSITVSVDNAHDLFSVPLLVKYDPAVIHIEDIHDGGFLSQGDQPIAIVQSTNAERGETMISAVRPPHVSGVTGSGKLFEVAVRGVAPGTSRLSIVGVDAKDSSAEKLPMVSHEATVTVEP